MTPIEKCISDVTDIVICDGVPISILEECAADFCTFVDPETVHGVIANRAALHSSKAPSSGDLINRRAVAVYYLFGPDEFQDFVRAALPEFLAFIGPEILPEKKAPQNAGPNTCLR